MRIEAQVGLMNHPPTVDRELPFRSLIFVENNASNANTPSRIDANPIYPIHVSISATVCFLQGILQAAPDIVKTGEYQ